MADNQIDLMAHLLRPPASGRLVRNLMPILPKVRSDCGGAVHPEKAPPALEDEDLIRRYHVDGNTLNERESCQTYWLYRMINTRRPLEEKIALYWHGIFATAFSKLVHPRISSSRSKCFARFGLGSLSPSLVELSRDPAMIFWLDNKDNHDGAVNENYGRELLELFSMGVGNYTEDDVRQASRAFTGWTIRNTPYHTARHRRDSVWPYGRLDWQFEYRDDDHDDAEKAFLGETGAFGGDDIIDIICRQPATARFISRHLYNFFVADEPQVPAWHHVPPRDPEAISILMEAFETYRYDIRSVLRVLLNSDFFKNAHFAKVKSPTELVVGVVRPGRRSQFPRDGRYEHCPRHQRYGPRAPGPSQRRGLAYRCRMDNHGETGRTGKLCRTAAGRHRPAGFENRLSGRFSVRGEQVSPEDLVDGCLKLAGPIEVSDDTKRELLIHARAGGGVHFGSEDEVRLGL